MTWFHVESINYPSAEGTLLQYWPSEASNEASNAERGSANKPPTAREGGPPEVPPEAPKIGLFISFPITIRAQTVVYWPGVVAVIYTEKTRKK